MVTPYLGRAEAFRRGIAPVRPRRRARFEPEPLTEAADFAVPGFPAAEETDLGGTGGGARRPAPAAPGVATSSPRVGMTASGTEEPRSEPGTSATALTGRARMGSQGPRPDAGAEGARLSDAGPGGVSGSLIGRSVTQSPETDPDAPGEFGRDRAMASGELGRVTPAVAERMAPSTAPRESPRKADPQPTDPGEITPDGVAEEEALSGATGARAAIPEEPVTATSSGPGETVPIASAQAGPTPTESSDGGPTARIRTRMAGQAIRTSLSLDSGGSVPEASRWIVRTGPGPSAASERGGRETPPADPVATSTRRSTPERAGRWAARRVDDVPPLARPDQPASGPGRAAEASQGSKDALHVTVRIDRVEVRSAASPDPAPKPRTAPGRAPVRLDRYLQGRAR